MQQLALLDSSLSDEAMRRIDRQELRFLVMRGLQMLPRQMLRDLAGSENVRSRALDAATDIITERLDHLEYEAPDPLPNHGW